MRFDTTRWIIVLALSGFIATAAPAQTSPADEKGRALVGELCTKCHGLDEIVYLRQSPEAWEDTVWSMVARGAPIYLDEVDVIIGYLSRQYGPTAAR